MSDLRIVASHLVGLFEGMSMDKTEGEVKLMGEIVSIIASISEVVDNLATHQQLASAELEKINAKLKSLDEIENQDSDKKEKLKNITLEIKVTCPACGEEIWISSGNLEDVICSFCGEEIEVDFNIE